MNDTNFTKLIDELPPEQKKEVEDFVLFLHKKYMRDYRTNKFTFEWEGALIGFADKYSAVELQQLANQWWEETNVSS